MSPLTIAVLVIALIWIAWIFNSFIRLRNMVEEVAAAGVAVEEQDRFTTPAFTITIFG